MKAHRVISLLTALATAPSGCAVPLDAAFRPTLAFSTSASTPNDAPAPPSMTSPIRSIAASNDPPHRAESDSTPGAWITMAILGVVFGGGGAAMIYAGGNTDKGANCDAANNPCAGKVILYTLGAVSAVVGAVFVPTGIVGFIEDSSSERHHEPPDTSGRFY
jgi:hypothetical protein